MSDNLSISVNGQSQVPPGFRFHPTEEELLQYYLRKKVAFEKIDFDVIQDVDLNKLEPWEIQEKCRIGSTPQNDWYFFSHKDKKYPTGTRTNRATTAGFWKATGRDKVIYSSSSRIGMRKTLVFYKGRAPHGMKSDWIMHEYRLDDNTTTIADKNFNVCNVTGDATQEEGWVVCRVFKKKDYCHKSLIGSPISTISVVNQCDQEGNLEHMLHYMGAPCRRINQILDDDGDNDSDNNKGRFLKLPSLQVIPNSYPRTPTCYQTVHLQMLDEEIPGQGSVNQPETERRFQDWTTLDMLVASQLNSQSETPKHLMSDESTMCCPVNDVHANIANHDYHSDHYDLWSFTGSTSNMDQLCHLHNIHVLQMNTDF